MMSLIATGSSQWGRGRGVDAAIAYEHRYGILPDAPFPTATAEDEPSIEPIPAEKFERLWQQGRASGR
jgi:hypothetical protein